MKKSLLLLVTLVFLAATSSFGQFNVPGKQAMKATSEVAYFLSWDVAPTANTPIYRAEHYSVWISTTGNQPEDFTTMLFEETLSTEHTNWVYQNREVNIDLYAGQTVFVAFRHHESTDMDRIVIDNIKLFKTNGMAREEVVFLFEDFQAGIDDPLGEDWVPEGWLNLDADGDNIFWYFGVRQGEASMRSESWNGGALTPDNWLITPAVLIETADLGYFLSWDVAPTASTPIYRTEHYSVWISTTGNQPEDFTTMLFEETLSTEHTNWVYQNREVNIDAYAGQNVYVAFRHHESTDMDRVVIDNIKLFKANGSEVEETVFLFEDFQVGIDDPLGEDWIPEGWLNLDADGDNIFWYFGVRQGEASMRSESWNGGALTPDNWLVTRLVPLISVGVIEKEPVQAEIVIFPNPARSHVTVRSDASIAEVELFNMIGNQVMKLRPENNQVTIDVSALKPGLYFVRLHTGQGIVSQKINISR